MTREADIQRAVIAHWKAFGLPKTLVACIPNQRAHGQYGLTPGLFDLLVFAPGLPLGMIELKREKGRLSEAQKSVRELCISLGIPHAVTWGRDEPIHILEDWGVVRKSA